MSAITDARVWHIRPGVREDVPGIVRLFQDSFAKPASKSWYRWKVFDSPWPIGAPMGWVAEAGDRVIGHYGGTPLRFRLGEDELRVVHTCDAMTAPEYRRQGVLTALGEAAHEAWSAAGAAFVLGLPTAKWGTRSAHLGYRTAFEIGWLWRPLRGNAVVPRRAGVASPALRLAGGLAIGTWGAAWAGPLERRGRGVSVEAIHRPGVEADRLWERLRHAYDASVVRDRAWLTYRYADAPGMRYGLLLARREGEPVGYLVYRVVSSPGRRSGWIVDLCAAPYDPAVAAALLRSTLARLRELEVDDVRAFAAAGTAALDALKGAGFVRRTGTYQVSVIPLAGPVQSRVLNDPTRWLFSVGDSDVV